MQSLSRELLGLSVGSRVRKLVKIDLYDVKSHLKRIYMLVFAHIESSHLSSGRKKQLTQLDRKFESKQNFESHY